MTNEGLTEHGMKLAGEHRLQVLIAERHRTVAESLGALVRELGHADVAGIATDPSDAVELGHKLNPDVAIVDLEMSPTCALISGLHSLSPETRIIALSTQQTSPGGLVKALAAGAVGAIYKESSLDALARALGSSSRSKPVVEDEAVGLLLESYLDVLTEKRMKDIATIEALAAAVEARDLATGDHLARVVDLAKLTMEHIDSDLARNEEVSYGFMLHDVGKIGVPDAILLKPGPLDGAEWSVMRRHPELGVRIVDPIGFSNATTDIILSHHEHWDGSGYPNGLMRDEIPLSARAFAVADAFDAMTSDRPYRSAMPRGAALEQLVDAAGTTFDPEITEIFVSLAA